MSEALAAITAWSVQAVILVAGTAVVLACARVRDPRARLAAWQATCAVAATTPFVLASLAPPRPVSAQTFSLVALASAPRVAAITPSELAAVAVASLAAVAAIRVLLLLLAWSRLRRLAARAETVRSAVFDGVSHELGVRARLVQIDSGTPYTFGRRAPVVAVDAQVLADDRTARAVFLHELAHVARGDWSAVVVEELVCRVLWFHPGAWWVAREMCVAREEIVDRVAAERLGSRRTYLDTLLTLSERSDSVRGSVPALVNRHHLARRIRALALEGPMSRRHLVSALVLLAFTLAGAAYGAAVASPLRAVAVVSVNDDKIEHPVPTKKVNPEYPQDAKDKRIEGEVALDVTVGADGLVKAAAVKKSIPELDAAALAAIKQWEFRPGRLKGKPVEVVVTITFAFTLK